MARPHGLPSARLLGIALIALLQWTLFLAPANASPFPARARTLWSRFVHTHVAKRDPERAGPDESDYPSDASIVSMMRQGLPTTGWVFWTEIPPVPGIPNQGQRLAEAFANQNGYTYIYHAFPDDFM